MKGVRYSANSPGLRMFIDQKYYDIKFNLKLDDAVYFDNSEESLKGFEIKKMRPT
jgi:hypothetical protein